MEFLKVDDHNLESNLAGLIKQIQMESESDCIELRNSAAEQQAAILRGSKQQAEDLKKRILDSAIESIEDYEHSSFSEIDLKLKHSWLESRETLLDEVWNLLFEKFDSVLKISAYARALPNFIIEAANVLGTKTLTIQTDPITRELLTADMVSTLSKTENLSIQIGDNLSEGHGIVALTQDGRQLFNNTLEARFTRNKTQLRNFVAQNLFERQV
jgi:vacuolar-type H+-ATPase subunit E/Vma4